MENDDRKFEAAKADETEISELGAEELQKAAGGSLWGDIEGAGEWVGHEVEAHPVAAVATVAGAVTGIGAIADVVAVAGSDAAAMAGVGTGDLVGGAVAKTAASVFSGGAIAGTIDSIAHVINDKKVGS
ncbi:hypothetical protein FJU08_21875 [Martelella alba]|uniref:Uncharacterized protein n=2 Tax=Martelella alba TaxID=2590451 RepID=A0A506U0B7_9HYPH|nr:hypothetical protein FJU08_21875 [Martelella alba]